LQATKSTRMETLVVIYDEAFQAEISAVVERGMVVPRYTRIDDVIGARMAEREAQSGYLADRRNRIILVVAEPPTIARMLSDLRALRNQKRRGIRAFVVPVSEVV
jgi:hypothetical protein